MSQQSATVIKEGARETPVVAETDVLVVGGGPAGICAAIAAARNGARVILTERYPHLGGLASGGQGLGPDAKADSERPPEAVAGRPCRDRGGARCAPPPRRSCAR